MHESKVANPVVLSGDIHSFWANDLKLDFDDPSSPTGATEFVGTSITAIGPNHDQMTSNLSANPHVKFFESRKRGYASVEVSRKQMTTRFQAVSDVTDPQATVSTLKTFVVEDGKPGAVEG